MESCTHEQHERKFRSDQNVDLRCRLGHLAPLPVEVVQFIILFLPTLSDVVHTAMTSYTLWVLALRPSAAGGTYNILETWAFDRMTWHTTKSKTALAILRENLDNRDASCCCCCACFLQINIPNERCARLRDEQNILKGMIASCKTERRTLRSAEKQMKAKIKRFGLFVSGLAAVAVWYNVVLPLTNVGMSFVWVFCRELDVRLGITETFSALLYINLLHIMVRIHDAQ
eukprot:PhM_4_TR18925/c0_g1_i1/m.63261